MGWSFNGRGKNPRTVDNDVIASEAATSDAQLCNASKRLGEKRLNQYNDLQRANGGGNKMRRSEPIQGSTLQESVFDDRRNRAAGSNSLFQELPRLGWNGHLSLKMQPPAVVQSHL